MWSAAHTHHADLPVSACLVVRVGGGLVRGLCAHRVLEGVATEGHALARIVVLGTALLVHEQFVALAREVARRFSWVRFGVRRRFGSCRYFSRVSFSGFLLVRSRCCFLFRFLGCSNVAINNRIQIR